MINIKKLFNLDYYTSQIDQFLAKYRQERHQLSESQNKEMKKYERIARMREQAEPESAQPEKIWNKF